MWNRTTAVVGRQLMSKSLGAAARAYMQRPFSYASGVKVSIYYSSNPISFSQVYPFLHYSDDFLKVYDVHFRCTPIEMFFSEKNLPYADIFVIQPWFTVDPDVLLKAQHRLTSTHPNSTIVFLDSFAHNDLRLGRYLSDSVRSYAKKSLYTNTGSYLQVYKGDTNLAEYYSNLYGLPAEPVNWLVPPSLLKKIQLTPGFFTAPNLIGRAVEKHPPGVAQSERTIDVHARLGSQGAEWYSKMRSACLNEVGKMSDLSIISSGNKPWPEYMGELERSKLCLSPFGYGELCWRDVEAFVAGSVVLKPDMSHLRTLPDLYEPYVTYIPIAWDFSDLQSITRKALRDLELRHSIAREAYRRIAQYINEAQFVTDMRFMFDP